MARCQGCDWVKFWSPAPDSYIVDTGIDVEIGEERAMQHSFVMTVIGRDRTGLVDSIARLISDNRGNWLESRMARLGGEFAGILRVQVPAESEPNLVKALQTLQSAELTVVIRPDETNVFAGTGKGASLSLVGQDRPGIIRQITASLARYKINVEELESECYSAPMSGEMMFSAIARLQVPESCAIADLRKELEAIGGELMVDISFTES
jgi:glycine cleavage system regulatory protein